MILFSHSFLEKIQNKTTLMLVMFRNGKTKQFLLKIHLLGETEDDEEESDPPEDSEEQSSQ